MRRGRYGDRMTVRSSVARSGRVLALVGIAALTAACSSGGSDRSQAGATQTAAAPTPTGSAAAPTPTPTPNLPGGCDQMLPFTDLDQALGRPLFGPSRYVLGVAEPSIGRTGRVTCQFGLQPNGRGGAPLEVGVSTYKDADSANERVAATVAALRSAATSQRSATVAGQQAVLIGTKKDNNLVVAQGDRTVAVTIARTLHVASLDKAAVGVAERVLANWGQ
jgi:hypothetical protein